jgi:hypothetical protein
MADMRSVHTSLREIEMDMILTAAEIAELDKQDPARRKMEGFKG